MIYLAIILLALPFVTWVAYPSIKDVGTQIAALRAQIGVP